MEIIYLLIPLSLVLVAVIIGFVVWAVRSGQFDDLERPAYSLLDDDDGIKSSKDAPPEKDNPRPGGEPGPRVSASPKGRRG